MSGSRLNLDDRRNIAETDKQVTVRKLDHGVTVSPLRPLILHRSYYVLRRIKMLPAVPFPNRSPIFVHPYQLSTPDFALSSGAGPPALAFSPAFPRRFVCVQKKNIPFLYQLAIVMM